VKTLTAILNRHVAPPLTVLSENTCLTASRSGRVSLVRLTIGSATNILPVPEWLKPHETLRDSCSRYNGQPVGTYWKAYYHRRAVSSRLLFPPW
jgi:hypothetical protein